MRSVLLAVAAALICGPATADPETVTACIACHTDPDDGFDIVGLAAMRSLPPEWPLFYEDAFDLDGNGIAGRVRHVAGHGVDAGRPFVALYGRHLAAARLEDFALIAGAAHDIDLSDAAALDAVIDAFLRQSPDPMPPDPAILARFEARGCGGCHVTDAFAHEGRHYRPLSDFLLHDLGDGPVRTAPLWGCADCLEAPGHSATLRE